jgi:hypothetical protein
VIRNKVGKLKDIRTETVRGSGIKGCGGERGGILKSVPPPVFPASTQVFNPTPGKSSFPLLHVYSVHHQGES